MNITINYLFGKSVFPFFKKKKSRDARGQRLSVPDGYKLSASPALTCAFCFLAGWDSIERRGLSPRAPAPSFFQNNEKKEEFKTMKKHKKKNGCQRL